MNLSETVAKLTIENGMQQSEIIEILIQNPWFSSLPKELADTLLHKSKIRVLENKQLLHKKNDQADGFHCVLKGRVRVSNVTLEGKELVLTWILPGTWFGEISLVDGLPRTHDAHAEGETTILKLPNNAFESMQQQYPGWQQAIMKLLCQRVRSTFSLIDETGCLSLKGQLCKRISLMYKGLQDHQTPTLNTPIELAISQDSLAQLIHSSRQTVNKILQNLQAENIVTIRYGKLQVLDINLLDKLSQI
ncbi:MAG: Crp/Fnr family transcriptional regulator [Paraglaciecola sp.]|uniref:Crp/Fnr family transcriptional regulator n=1 Tax=Paraglaciecola sp. TaxID=1920173 RepID=UPI00329A300A